MQHDSFLEEKAAIQRAAIAHRARWMALVFEEMENDGIPNDQIERILRRAVRRCGRMDGLNYRNNAKDPESIE